MGKFGKKVVVNEDLSKYLIGVMAQSGFGKTTLTYNVCEKLFGPDGYMIFDIGTEDGTAALEGANAEKIENWLKFREVVTDIVKNKDSDYPNLKLVILDTLDATFEIVEPYCVDKWNRENAGKKDFTKVTSINGVEGGYGRGLDKAIETVKAEIARLKSVGVGVWWNAHVKEKDQTDLYTGASYTTLTANMSKKYFDSIKNSSHVIAFGYFDRSIERQAVGEENPVTHKKHERKTVSGELRKLKFRDDAMVADAKSRFAHIVDEIDLDADKFIQALQDAIRAERTGEIPVKTSSIHVTTPKVIEIPTNDVKEEPVSWDSNENDSVPFDVDEDIFEVVDAVVEFASEERVSAIKDSYKAASPEVKAAVQNALKENGYNNHRLPNEVPDGLALEIERLLGL